MSVGSEPYKNGLLLAERGYFRLVESALRGGGGGYRRRRGLRQARAVAMIAKRLSLPYGSITIDAFHVHD